jgi:hypothetical protein
MALSKHKFSDIVGNGISVCPGGSDRNAGYLRTGSVDSAFFCIIPTILLKRFNECAENLSYLHVFEIVTLASTNIFPVLCPQ